MSIIEEVHDAPTGPAVLSLRGVTRRFAEGKGTLTVFDGLDLDVPGGELTALVGPSGSGKSSLLHIAGLLERPSAGDVMIAGREASRLSDGERTRIRRTEIGFVYQFHNLLAEFSAEENVALPLLVAGEGKQTAKQRARDLLGGLGLADRVTHRPAELSGGEQQRVAIARALANRPRILLADEPTGNLDPRTSDHVFEALLSVCREEGAAALIATHNLALAERMDRLHELVDGRLVAH